VRKLVAILWRLLRALPLALVSPFLVLIPFLALTLADGFFWLFRKRRPLPADIATDNSSASVVIPNWNGRDLLAQYLPSVLEALRESPGSEIIVVDNGSTDDSLALLRERFPQVRAIALKTNLGFGGGSNAGFREARNDVVVLLNSDMRVAPDFLAPLLAPFEDSKVFSVSCQILFSDPARLREETGLTQGWWENGGLRVRHRIDPGVREPFPCFYGGGGSCAFDRRKFLELGGFDELLSPFYLEDTDLGFLAWKRGWKVLYQPASLVWHEHRGTIGKHFTPAFIESVLKKNFLLFCWKNVHEWPRLFSHFFFAFAGALLSLLFGDSPERPNVAALWRAFRQLPGAVRSRWRARRVAAVSDTEAFLRPLGGYFRDRFETLPVAPDRLNVLFVSPYPISPPIHGGAVFMYQTARELAWLCSLHLLILLDYEAERAPHQDLEKVAATAEYVVRRNGHKKEVGSILPFAVREFANAEVEWLIHRQIYTQRIDVVQLEYTALAQYSGSFRRIACILFEHDVYFQSIGSGLGRTRGALARGKATFEYLRAIRYELEAIRRFDRIQVCTRENKEYLLSFEPELAGRIDDDLRAGIDVGRYEFRVERREPYTMLFLGSFRHPPNVLALDWFARLVLPRVIEKCPQARLVVAGSDPPPRHSLPDIPGAIEILGFVEDVREPLGRYALFVCPILSGSGMRVKLLEAFAAGITVVSTRLGAEGLAANDGEICALADDPEGFAERIVELFADPERSANMAGRARAEVASRLDMRVITERLVSRYGEVVAAKRSNRLP
jgi:GT2 family glycosyltransferase/glycosyltransferase involved in cell wall biosynthesis